MIISPDSYLWTPEGKYLWTPERVSGAWAEANKEFSETLKSGRYGRVVLVMGSPGSGKTTWLSQNFKPGVLYFEAVFKNAFTREPYLSRARCFGIYPEVVWVDSHLEVCLQRNSMRSPDRKVPEDLLRGMWETIREFPPDPKVENFKLTLVRT